MGDQEKRVVYQFERENSPNYRREYANFALPNNTYHDEVEIHFFESSLEQNLIIEQTFIDGELSETKTQRDQNKHYVKEVKKCTVVMPMKRAIELAQVILSMKGDD